MPVNLLSTITASSSGNAADFTAAAPSDNNDASRFLTLLTTSIASQFGSLSISGNSAEFSNPITTPLSREPAATRQFSSSPSEFAAPQPQAQSSSSSSNSSAPVQQPISQVPQEKNSNTSQQGGRIDTQTSPDTSRDNRDNAGSASASTSKSPASDSSSDNQATDPLQSQKSLGAALHEQLNNISQILSAAIQFLTVSASAAPVTTTAASGTTKAVTGATADNTNPNILLASQVAGQLLPGQILTNSDELALLKDLQSVVQQLQQTLQGNGQNSAPIAPSAPAATPIANTGTSADDTVPDAFLQQALNQLSQLLAQQKPAATVSSEPLVLSGIKAATAASPAPDASIPSQAPSASTTGDIVSLIKSTIAVVRQQLQTLNAQNEAIFSQAQNNSQPLGIDPKELLNNALSANGFTVSNTAQTAVSYSGAAAAQAQTAAPAPISNDAFLAAGISITAQSGNNSSNAGSDGNGQGQPQAQAIVQPGPLAPQASTANAGANFSKLLDQQAAPAPLPDQVAFQVKTALKDGSSTITIQLHPADLGKVNVNLSVDSTGKTSVSVTADNHHTLELLQRDSQGLSRALNDAGLKTDSGSLSFNLSNGQQQQRQTSDQNTVAAPVASYQKSQPEDEPDSNLTILTRSYVMNVAEGLDIQI